MTPAEQRLWQHLRGGQIGGARFRRQQILDGFIVDFYCHSANLIVEVDGAVHDQQAEYDGERDRLLATRGLRILRFTNAEVIGNLAAVLARLAAVCTPL